MNEDFPTSRATEILFIRKNIYDWLRRLDYEAMAVSFLFSLPDQAVSKETRETGIVPQKSKHKNKQCQ